MAESERAFVRETCAKVRWPRTGVTWSDWLAIHGPVIDAWLAAGECLVYDLDGIVVAFLVSAGHSVRCLYVKRDFRGDKLGLQLVTARWPGFVELAAYRTTPSFRRWAQCHGLVTREVGA